MHEAAPCLFGSFPNQGPQPCTTIPKMIKFGAYMDLSCFFQRLYSICSRMAVSICYDAFLRTRHRRGSQICGHCRLLPEVLRECYVAHGLAGPPPPHIPLSSELAASVTIYRYVLYSIHCMLHVAYYVSYNFVSYNMLY